MKTLEEEVGKLLDMLQPISKIVKNPGKLYEQGAEKQATSVVRASVEKGLEVLVKVIKLDERMAKVAHKVGATLDSTGARMALDCGAAP